MTDFRRLSKMMVSFPRINLRLDAPLSKLHILHTYKYYCTLFYWQMRSHVSYALLGITELQLAAVYK